MSDPKAPKKFAYCAKLYDTDKKEVLFVGLESDCLDKEVLAELTVIIAQVLERGMTDATERPSAKADNDPTLN